MSFSDLVAQNQRLVILQLLAEDSDYAHNDSVLRIALRAVGHDVSADKLKTELAWLAEQGLITTTTVQTFTVARLTTRGLDVSKGLATVPGVDRPGPGQ